MVYCSINGCNASNDKRLNRVKWDPDRNLHFYRFPRQNEYCKAWETICARHGKFNTKNAFICSKHFKPDDYARNLKHELLNYFPINTKKLKADAIPTVNIPSASRVDEQSGNSEASALSTPTSIPTPVATSVKQPTANVESREKLGVDKIQTVTGSEEKLTTKVGPDPNIVDNSPQCWRDAPVASITSKEAQLKNNLEPLSTDRWHEAPFAIENSTQRKGDVCVAYFRPSDLSPEISKSVTRRSAWNSETPGTTRWYKVQLEFLSHVMMVWVNRGRNGNPNIVMLDCMLKNKAKEAAAILGTFISPFKWLQSFKEKLRKEDAKHPPQYRRKLRGLSMNIADVIEDEWLRYQSKDSDISLDEIELNAKEVPDTTVQKAFVLPSIVDWDTPIESHFEALACLTMVENYALSTRNFRAVGVITDLEKLLTLECQ